jgi:hypothetical protein
LQNVILFLNHTSFRWQKIFYLIGFSFHKTLEIWADLLNNRGSVLECREQSKFLPELVSNKIFLAISFQFIVFFDQSWNHRAQPQSLRDTKMNFQRQMHFSKVLLSYIGWKVIVFDHSSQIPKYFMKWYESVRVFSCHWANNFVYQTTKSTSSPNIRKKVWSLLYKKFYLKKKFVTALFYQHKKPVAII